MVLTWPFPDLEVKLDESTHVSSPPAKVYVINVSYVLTGNKDQHLKEFMGCLKLRSPLHLLNGGLP